MTPAKLSCYSSKKTTCQNVCWVFWVMFGKWFARNVTKCLIWLDMLKVLQKLCWFDALTVYRNYLVPCLHPESRTGPIIDAADQRLTFQPNICTKCAVKNWCPSFFPRQVKVCRQCDPCQTLMLQQQKKRHVRMFAGFSGLCLENGLPETLQNV